MTQVGAEQYTFAMKYSALHPYPNDFEAFLDWFPTEQDCVSYLEWIRWQDGFTCPKCGQHSYWKQVNGDRMCKSCGHQASARAGTVFEDGRKPLRLWFAVMWLLMAQKTGMSAKNFYDTFGFGSYQTTWGWLQKLRSVMIRSGRDKLTGRVEVDETLIGGQHHGVRGRGDEAKILVLVAVEGEKDKKLGRVRFRVVGSAVTDSVIRFVQDYVAEGSTVVTDGLKSYNKLDNMKEYVHESYKMTSRHHVLPNPDSRLDHVHLVISLLKRWLDGTHQGAVTPAHLTGYLDEFAFRFNRRLSTHRGKLFYRLMQQAVTTRPKPIKDYYMNRGSKKPRRP